MTTSLTRIGYRRRPNPAIWDTSEPVLVAVDVHGLLNVGGASRAMAETQELPFAVDAELIVYGVSHPHAHVTLQGEPVPLRPDGSFTVRMSLPDRRQVIPVIASSSDGVEQRTIILAVERNTKVLGRVVRDSAG